MRHKVIVLIIMVALLALTLPAQATVTEVFKVNVSRVVRIGDYGLVTVEDRFMLLNNSTETVESFLAGFPRNYSANLRYVQAKDSEGKILAVDLDVNVTSPFYLMKLNMAKPIGFNETYNFTLTMLFTGLVKPIKDGFTFSFAAAPALQVRAEAANVTIVAPFGTEFKVEALKSRFNATTYEGKPALNATYRPLEPFMNESLSVNYTSPSQFIVLLERIEREILLSEDGSVSVSDMYRFKNLAGTLTSLPLRLHRGSTDIMAYDAIGPIWTQPRTAQDVTISPRYPGGIKADQTFTFTLRYRLSRGMNLRQLAWWGLYNFTFDIVSNLQHWIAEEVRITILVPKGFSLDSITLGSKPLEPVSLFEDKLVFEAEQFTPYHNATFSMIFRYTPFWAPLKALSWVVVVEVALFAFIAVLRARRPAAEAVPVPVAKLREFVELYDEKTALRSELERMEKDVARGALRRHEFRRRKKTMDLRVDEINKALVSVKRELRSAHPRYDEMIRRLDRAEAELEATRVSEAQITAQYRSGKIGKEAYETILSDLEKRVDKAKETIETTLVTLREEAR